MTPLLLPAPLLTLIADLANEEDRSAQFIVEDAVRLYVTVGRRVDLERQKRAAADWDTQLDDLGVMNRLRAEGRRD